MKNAEKRRKLGKRIKLIRVDRDLSQRQLELMAGLGYNHVSKIERGVSNVTFDTLCKLAQALDVELVDLLSKV